MLPLVYDSADLAAEEQLLLAEATAGWCERYPDVHVTRRLYLRTATQRFPGVAGIAVHRFTPYRAVAA